LKTFILKLLVSVIFIYLLFEFTVGKRIDYFEDKVTKISNKENREDFKSKILEELDKANNKDFILDEKERKIISAFIKKINNELKLEKN
jgi:hypothetical protein